MSLFKLCLKVSCVGTLATCLSCVPTAAEDWPQWRGAGRDGVWQESGLVETFAAAEIPRRWTVPIGAGSSGPTVSDGRVLVMDRVTEPEAL